MSKICNNLHHIFQNMKRYSFPFNDREIPDNGIYILFEKNETAHNGERIVRVGTHTGNNNLLRRLKEHFLIKNKDRSIFRKNIGRAILSKNNNNFLEQWEWDLTKRKDKEKYLPFLDIKQQEEIEEQVSEYIQNNLSFCVFQVQSKEERLDLESKIISTISLCNDCQNSSKWLGSFSPKNKIRESGLWLVQGLYKTPLSDNEFEKIKSLSLI